MPPKSTEQPVKVLRIQPYDDGSFEADFTIPRGPGWKIRAFLQRLEGQFVVTRLCVEPIDESAPPGGIGQRLLRVVPGDLARVLADNDQTVAKNLGLDELATIAGGDAAARELASNRHPGRRGRRDEFYAEWAAKYVSKCATSSSPNADLAAEHGYSVHTITDFVRKARERDLLTDGPKGRPGGALTQKAMALLDGESAAAAAGEPLPFYVVPGNPEAAKYARRRIAELKAQEDDQ